MSVDEDSQLTGTVIGAAIAVHRELGPGLEETAYESALSVRLGALGVPHQCQRPLPLIYRGVCLDCDFRLDVLVESRLPVELKAVEVLLPIHDAQLLTYMRLGQHPLGLLLNFDVPVLKEGIYRKALSHPPQAEPQSPADLRDGFDSLSAEVLHAALDVHRALGPGLMRSAYEECLCHELSLRCIPFQRPHRLPLRFDHRELGQMAEVPLVVCSAVPVICLSAAALTRLHEARLLARLRQGGWPHGFLLNFNAPTLKQGIRRLTLA